MTSLKKISGHIKKEVVLNPHQQAGVDKFVSQDGNQLFAHSVGTGKTLTAIASFDAMKKKGKAKRALVVVPSSLKDNFAQDGVKKFTDYSYSILGNKQEQGQKNTTSLDKITKRNAKDFNIVSYDLFKKDPEAYIKNTGSDTVIYDELHRAKNETSKISDVIKRVRPLHRNMIGLTGSIVSNSPADIVPLVDAMTDGKHFLGSKESFESRFLSKGKNGISTIKNTPVLKAVTSKYIDYADRDDMDTLKPPKREYKNHEVVMSPLQGDMYRYAIDKLDPVTKMKLRLGTGALSNTEVKKIGNKLISMRQISNAPHTAATKMKISDSYEASPKAKMLISNVKDHLKKTKDGQVMIGTQFIKGGVDIMEHALKKEKIPYSIFIGKGNKGISEKSRKKAIEDYNSGKSKVMLLSSAGGEGINLPNTTEVHLLDGHFNPEAISQLEARGIRAGGQSHRKEKDRKVTVHKYESLQDRKAATVYEGMMDAINPLGYITRLSEGKDMFVNPFDRGVSADKWVSDVARRKSETNKGFTDSLRKKAATLIDPESKIMSKYHNTFGEKVNDVIGTDNFIDKEKELKLVDRLRDSYKRIANSKTYERITVNKKTGRPTSFARIEDFDDDGKMKLSTLLNPARNTALYGGGAVLGGALLSTVAGPKKKSHASFSRAIPLIFPSMIASSVGVSRFRGDYGTMPKAEARRKLKLKDEELLRMLRGENVSKEQIKTDHYSLK